MTTPKISLLNANTLELHYWFKDQTHTMDAIIQNKCESEFLGVITEIAKSLGYDVLIETEPLSEGGLRRWFKILLKKDSDKKTILIALITAFTTSVIFTPIGTSLAEIGKQIIEKVFEDDEIKEIEKEILKARLRNIEEDSKTKELEQQKIKEEIKSLQIDSESKLQNLSNNIIISKKKSNFYTILDKYPKVEQFSITIENEDKHHVLDESVIQRANFKEFIIVSDELKSIKDENAIIEIISPVLKKGDYQWKGIYKGESISFNMKSNEFKTLVQTGNIEFKNGSSINCILEIKRKIDNEGNVKITEHNINQVNEYFENDTPIETPEGKRYRQKQEADKQQLKLDLR
ncbi:hypothetical protein LJC52_02635 [Bacteroidales bacterium OttesenSCG-928-A17]|nr:hypothetical protein [Bacteroidales bacterium OttesenSCG-928-A17]